MNYRAEIDGLRALAVLPVILFHAGFEWFSGGFVGVDVFFVISGYLITTIIISEMDEGKFSIVNFYERRARRILPALFFVMAVCLPFAWLWMSPSDLKAFGQSLVAVSTFSSNIFFWQETGYFDTATELKPLLHHWSLAVEEQYYILFPVFLLLTWRLGIKWVLMLLSLVFIVSLGVAHWAAFNRPSAAFYLLPTRGWELLVGVFIAFYLKYNPYLKSYAVNQILSLLGFGMLVYSIAVFDENTPFPSLYALVPTVGTGLLIISAVQNTIVRRLLSLKPIVGIGLISYSAYLWHQPLLAFSKYRLLGEVSYFLLFILCITSLIMAWFSWRYVEKPFRDKKETSRKFIYRFSLVGMIGFILVGIYLHASNGNINRLTENQRLLFGNFINASSYVVKRHQSIILKEFDSNKDKKNVLIIGDSYAEDLTNAVFEAGLDSKFNFSGYLIPGVCGILFVEYELLEQYVQADCKSKPHFYDEHLLSLIAQADQVWLASRWPEFSVKFMRRSIEKIKKYNESVLVFGSKNFGSVSAAWFNLNEEENWQVGNDELGKENFIELDELNNSIKEEVLLAGGKFINSQEVICDGAIHCPNFRNYDLISHDGGHLTPYGAKLFGDKLSSLLLEQ